MEGIIPVEEFQNDKEFEKLKIGSQIDVYLEKLRVLRRDNNF